MLPNQKILVKWYGANKKHFISKGYVWTKQGDEFEVDVKDLSNQSTYLVTIVCDYCRKEYKKPYWHYIDCHKKDKINKDACKKCKNKKLHETLEIKHGVKYPRHIKEPLNKKLNKDHISISFLRQQFKDRNLLLVEECYINGNTEMSFICLKHKEHGIQTIKYNYFKYSSAETCEVCQSEKISGENSWSWKGGITSLRNHLWYVLKQWKFDSLKFYQFKCVVTDTNNHDLEVHHLYSYNLILNETLEELKIPIYELINLYTQNELNAIKKLFLRLHYEKYGYGIPLKRKIHEEFHRIYGYGNNTPEQFKEFLLNNYGQDLVDKVFFNAQI